MINVNLTFNPSAEIDLEHGGNVVSLAVINQGVRGYSAYEVALQNGFIGTEAQWLASLQGSAALLFVSLIAPSALGGNRGITAAGTYADCSDTGTINQLAGITQFAVNLGEAVNVIYAGELDGFAGLTANQPVFLSTNGTLTQTAPTSGYVQKVGLATATDKILINIDAPIQIT